MAQSPQQWRSGSGEIAWLSMLVATLEKLSDPDERARPCDPDVLAAAKAHLALPARFQSFYGSRFSLRN
ncbi:MAG: transcriptional regulator [Rhizobiales bacterium]|nr:transcriptional regulator [Hyphomicrobiales bacterium]